MKRRFLLIVFLSFIIMTIVGCGAQQTVPEKTLEWVVSDYIDKNQLDGPCLESSYQVTHDPDRKTNSDSVRVYLTMNCQHVTATSTYEATYQYDKSSGLWTLCRGGLWDKAELISLHIDDTTDGWNKSFQEVEWIPEVKKEGVECVREGDVFTIPVGEMVNDGTTLRSEDLAGYWVMSAHKQYDGDIYGYCEVEYLRFENENNAKITSDYYREILENTLGYELKSKVEKDQLTILRYALSFYEEEKTAIVIQQDGAVYVVMAYLENYEMGGQDFASILESVGYNELVW